MEVTRVKQGDISEKSFSSAVLCNCSGIQLCAMFTQRLTHTHKPVIRIDEREGGGERERGFTRNRGENLVERD